MQMVICSRAKVQKHYHDISLCKCNDIKAEMYIYPYLQVKLTVVFTPCPSVFWSSRHNLEIMS